MERLKLAGKELSVLLGTVHDLVANEMMKHLSSPAEEAFEPIPFQPCQLTQLISHRHDMISAYLGQWSGFVTYNGRSRKFQNPNTERNASSAGFA